MQSWHGSWRDTYLRHTQPGYTTSHKPLVVGGVYSDLLHRSWVCASMEMLPEWLEVENVDRCVCVIKSTLAGGNTADHLTHGPANAAWLV